ncbi:OmpP1/FadL family transporter [Fulvivirga sedimenti]|uniref:Outer membrane protein transport protein n=1 Tax=Fulvivirga sedimenti TaxID=2879465 RepID=A0A9X1HYT7_9BACT|nr:outer membrane protein transport protein [Fulvivirga sedimenti]MCA6079102.1 outer membrane protein transport protein [Fulvivirga sedimenti]
MKTYYLQLILMMFSTLAFSQSGHIMQGVGAVNMSMGGAATGQPLDISGAIQWNPASISAFDSKIIKLDVGLFFSSPKLSSSLPAGMLGPGAPGVSGTTQDDRGVSPMPALAMLWGKEDSRHTFAASAFGISGFGVTFPEESNNPLNPAFNPMENSNPINYPQQAMGFGRIESDYGLFQMGFTWAYEITEKFSIGIQPTFNYATLELMPNPTANPSMAGYPSTDKASSIGYGAQFGLFFDSGSGLKLGASYKTVQSFSDFEFDNTYLDNSKAKSKFNMDYPSILSFGVGYTMGKFDLAADYRLVNYEGTDGFNESGWTQTASVKGFGWENINIISAGLQFRGISMVPLRVGYTYNSNPINSEMAFFNVPATAIIKNAFQVGFSVLASDFISIDATYHHGSSGSDATSGPMYSPMMINSENPLGAIPGSNVSYEMTTDLVMVGFSYRFKGK